MPWADKLITYRTGKTKAKAGKGTLRPCRAIAHGEVRPGGPAAQQLQDRAGLQDGRDRAGRRLRARRARVSALRQAAAREGRGKFVPTPIVKYYLGLAQYLGSDVRDLKLELFVTDAERRDAEDVLARCGLDRHSTVRRARRVAADPAESRRQYGAAKCWLPEYFAQLADRFIDELGATVLIGAAPKERRSSMRSTAT